MKNVILILSIFMYFNSFGQTLQYQDLLDTALSQHGALFIFAKPIIGLQLDSADMRIYSDAHRDYENKVLDTVMIAQIIRNSKYVDTTFWQQNELNNYILVGNRDENIPIKSSIQRLGLTDKKQIRLYKNRINRYNIFSSNDRDIFYFSKLVFDNSKQFAIIEWDDSHSGLGGGGGIILYQLQGAIWEEVGVIKHWNY